MILPGLCDVHNHGYNNGSANNATPEWLKKWTAYLPQEGVTSIVASISSHPKQALLKACRNIAENIENLTPGAHIIEFMRKDLLLVWVKKKEHKILIVPITVLENFANTFVFISNKDKFYFVLCISQ